MRMFKVETVRHYPVICLIGPVLLTSMFWTSGLEKIGNFPATIAQVQRYGLPFPALIAGATILVQLFGSGLVIWNGRFAWLGAGALAVFTLLTIPVAHAYWNLQGQARAADLHLVLEHVSIVGALLILMINVPRNATDTATPQRRGVENLHRGTIA